MTSASEVSKNIKFYLKEMKKWEKRVFLSLTTLLATILLLNIVHLILSDWNVELITNEIDDYYKYFLVSPVIIYFRFSLKQYNSSKSLLDLNRSNSVKIKLSLELLGYDKQNDRNQLEKLKNVS